MNLAVIQTFINTKVIPFIGAISAALPGIITTNEADFTAAVNAILKLVSDFQSDLAALVTAAKSV